MSKAAEVFDKLAEQKYVLKKKKQSKKQKAKRALKRGVSTGVSSGVLTTLFNAGNPNALKHGAKFGGIVVPAVAALSYMGQPNYRMKLKKVANYDKVKHNLQAGMKPYDAVKKAYPKWPANKIKAMAKQITNSKPAQDVGKVVASVGAFAYDIGDRAIRGKKSPSHPFHKKASFKQRFISKYMEEFKKEAQVGGMMGKAQGWLPYIAASIVAGSVLQSVQAFIDKVIDKIEEHGHKAKGKDYFEKMLKAHPTLTKEDPDVVAKYWESLYHFAPSMGQDPLAAGAYIRQSIDKGLEEVGGPSADMVKNLTDIDSSHARTMKERKPSTKFIDVASAHPGTDVASILMKQDVQNNPQFWGIKPAQPRPQP
jgi:hypothetical protein